ncbi:MAG: hypothetical protein ACYTG6_08735, partial [Planctomycetota bacterium]
HLRRLWDVLDEYEDEPVPDGFAARVFDAAGLGRGSVDGRGWRLLRRPFVPLAAAALVLVAIGAFLWFPPGRDGTETLPSTDIAQVLEEVPVDLLEDADVLLSLSDDEFEAWLIEAETADALAEGSQGG